MAVLEYCTYKFKQFLTNVFDEDGAVVQIVFKKNNNVRNPGAGGFQSKNRASWKTVGTPLVVRVNPTVTVAEFRKAIGQRIGKALAGVDHSRSNGHAAAATASTDGEPGQPSAEHGSRGSSSLSEEASPQTLIMRQVALSFETKVSSSKSYHSTETLGALGSVTFENLLDRVQAFAKPSTEEEQQYVAKLVKDGGKIILAWPTHLNDAFEEERIDEREEFYGKDQPAKDVVVKQEVASVMECIEKYCQTEQLEESDMWYCSRCKEHVQAWKHTYLYQTPRILVIHLKRFHFSSVSHRRDKLDTLVQFPLEGLDLSDMVMHWNEGETPIYDCYAVSNHFGGMGGGHYTAYAKGDDGKWCYFDDSRVTPVSNEAEVVSSAAYCLYYKRRDVIVNTNDELLTPVAESKEAPVVDDSCSGTLRENMDVDNMNESIVPSPCSSPVVSFTEEDQTDDTDGECATPLVSNDERDAGSYSPLEI